MIRCDATHVPERDVTEQLIFLALLTFISLPFAGIAAFLPRVWAIAIPVAFWVLVFVLQDRGLIPGTMYLGTALFAAGYGLVFAWAGTLLQRLIRP
jgi:hypothetical protein